NKDGKLQDLQNFIARFSENASTSKQATSHKKLLDRISVDDIIPSSRRYSSVSFTPSRDIAKASLRVEPLTKNINGQKVMDNVSFTIHKDEKVAFVGKDDLAKTTLFEIIMGNMEPDSGTYHWGVTTSQEYFPKDNSAFFENNDLTLVDWL